MKKLILFTATILLTLNSFATHNLAGDISYTHISGLTYSFTVRTFTNSLSAADRCFLKLYIGSDSITLQRMNGASTLCPSSHDGEMLCTGIKYNIYQGNYTFSGNGNYTFSLTDPERSEGICNVPNSENTPFILSGEMNILPLIGYNNSPQYSGAALISNTVGTISNYNPNAINTETDSLYFDFVLTSSITLPPASSSVTINHQTGQIIWDAPNVTCNYIFDVVVKEYRKVNGTAYYIGSTMQEIFTNNCSTTLSVKENNFEEKIILFPNPTSGNFTIFTPSENAEICITDLFGKQIIQTFSTQKNLNVQLEYNGVYFINVKTKSSSTTKKLVVNK